MRYKLNEIKAVFKKKGYQFFTEPWKLNIIGVRMDTKDVNLFDDLLYLIYTNNQGQIFVKEYPITTDPGKYYLQNPSNPNGTAILVPKQYINKWIIRPHAGRYPALGQERPVMVYRDNNLDLVLNFDVGTIQTGVFGINIHRSNSKSESTYVNKWSAGCQVFKRARDFNELMAIANKSKTVLSNNFSYTLLVENDFNTVDPVSEQDDAKVINRGLNISATQTNLTQTPSIPKPNPNSEKDRFKNVKSKEILVKKERKLKLPELKIADTDEEAEKLESEFTGSMMPFLIFNTHTFNYKQIENLTLTYDGPLPKLKFVIYDVSNEFTTLFLPSDDDDVALYLKPHNSTYKPIYMRFTPIVIKNTEGYFTFTCLPKIPTLYMDKIQAFSNLTSYDVFSQIADELQLGFASNVDNTDDKMTWLMCSENYIQFMNKEINHVYKDETSFFTWFIDYFYNINFVELNNQFGIYREQNTFLSLIDPVAQEKLSDGNEFEFEGKLIFSNVDHFRGTSNYIVDYGIINNSGEIKIREGYEKFAQFFDSELNEFQNQKVTPNYETNSNNYIRPNKFDSSITKDVYLGLQQTNSNTKNVHDNYLYAHVFNKHNKEEINKMKLKISLDKANFHIYKNQSIPIAIYEYEELNKHKLGVKNNIDVQEEKPRAVLLEQYSGHYVIDNISFHYTNDNYYIKQEITLTRREWPKPKQV